MKPISQTPRLVRKGIENAQKSAFKSAKGRATGTGSARVSKTAHGPVPSIELYQHENSPASHSVRNRLTRLGLDFVAHTVTKDHPLKHEQLVQAGGKDQIPFLVDHSTGVKLYKSAAILTYLEKTYAAPVKNPIEQFAQRIDLQIRDRADQIAWTLRTPMIRARELQIEMRGALKMMRGSFGFLRDRIQSAMNKPARTESPRTTAPQERPKSVRTRPVKANVSSLTEAA